MNESKSWVLRALALLGAVFSSHAWLTLFTLLVLMGLSIGLTRAGLRIATNSASTNAVVSKGAESRSWGITSDDSDLAVATPGRSDASACGQFLVVFRPESSASQVIKALQLTDSFVVFGPDENLAFEVRVGVNQAKTAQRVLEESHVVASAKPNPSCP